MPTCTRMTAALRQPTTDPPMRRRTPTTNVCRSPASSAAPKCMPLRPRAFVAWRIERIESGTGTGSAIPGHPSSKEHPDSGRGHDRECNPTENLQQYWIDPIAHHFAVAGEQDDQQNERRSKDAIDHRRPEQHLHGIQAGVIKYQPYGHGNG